MKSPRIHVLLIAGALLTPVACGDAATELFRRALSERLAEDPIADLPDGLHVALCGSGGPLPDPERAGPCVAVVAGETLFVVDAGSGGARNLQGRIGWPPGRIAAVFLTHMHSDHIDGLGELGQLRWIGGGPEGPLPVYGTGGVVEVVVGFERAYQRDRAFRIEHHGRQVLPPEGWGFEPRAFRAPPERVDFPLWSEGGVEVTAWRVDHDPAKPAVAYRFDYGGRSVLVSGDTAPSGSLLVAAEDVDLLVHEALSRRLVALMQEAAQQAGRTRLAKIFSDIPGYHTTPVQAAELAERVGAGHLLFYHVVPPLPLRGLESAFLEGVSDVYAGGVTLGRDGTRVSLPRDGGEIRVDR